MPCRVCILALQVALYRVYNISWSGGGGGSIAQPLYCTHNIYFERRVNAASVKTFRIVYHPLHGGAFVVCWLSPPPPPGRFHSLLGLLCIAYRVRQFPLAACGLSSKFWLASSAKCVLFVILIFNQ